MPKIKVERKTIVDKIEIHQILKAVDGDDELLFAVAVAWETGARIGEIGMLTKKDFSENGDCWIVSMPTEKQRTKIHGQMPRRVLHIKMDWIYKDIISPIVNSKNSEFQPILRSNQKMLWKRLKSKYPDVYFHWLRHSRATIWSRTFDILTLQYSMGWSTLNIANRYIHNTQMGMKMRELQQKEDKY